MVWSRALAQGSQQGTPLVYDGVLYMPNPRDVIQALDAATGDLLWEYRRPRPDDLHEHVYTALGEANRNIAIHGRHLIGTSADGYVYAVEAATGRLAWETRDRRLHAAPGPPDLRPDHRRRQGDIRARLPARRRAARLLHRGARRGDRRGVVAPSADTGAPASRATRPGAACLTRSARTSAPGWCRATTRSSTSCTSARR